METIGKNADIVITMVGFPKDLEDVVLHSEHGLINFMKPGSVLVDHTTSKPDLAERIAKELKAKGIGSVDAPVSGGEIGAINGQVVSMCGGENEDFERVASILSHYSKKVKLMGGPGKGQHTKMAN